MENQTDLPLPEKDLPLPEKELSSPSQKSNSKTNILKSKFFLGFILASGLIAFLIGGFVLGLNESKDQTVCTQEAKMCSDGSYVGRSGPNCEFAKCPSLDSNQTANWKTYVNTVLGYEIKYPKDINIEKLNERDILVTRLDVPYGGQEGKVPTGGMTIYYRGDEGLEKGNDLPGDPATKTTINGFPALQVKYQQASPYINDIFISDLENKRVIRGSINTAGDRGYEESSYKTFSQILSTFRFD
ncbi:MAG: hypothetical protein COU25_00640 [Candidatus Levybacteria bacterium CG10_big_fil_rev_8_21_14_0_10_35_13]|nr:MAG: hypothetical protein COU25_00640 [Candidatus Levybacteria bacterium CG10_big_fil_rev_8_21_14_0_10_35_13]